MDHRHWKSFNGEFVEIPPIKELSNMLQAKFLEQEEEIQRVKKENDYLKQEHYKDEELSKLKARNETLKRELSQGFGISDEEYSAIKQWLKENNIRDSFYEFSSYPMGYIGKIKDYHGNEFEFHSL